MVYIYIYIFILYCLVAIIYIIYIYTPYYMKINAIWKLSLSIVTVVIPTGKSFPVVVPVRRPPRTPCACTAHRCRPLQRSALRRFAWSRRSAGFSHRKIEVFMGKSWENVRKSSINGGLQLGKSTKIWFWPLFLWENHVISLYFAIKHGGW